MEAIKKKMQAMKVEKDNAMDRADVCEQVWIELQDTIQDITMATLRRPRMPRCVLARLRRRLKSW